MEIEIVPIDPGTLRLRFIDGQQLAREAVLERWRRDDAFVDRFTEALASCRFSAFFWECPPTTLADLSAPFECVLVQAPTLARVHADPSAFAEHLTAGVEVVRFANLSGDSHLIALPPLGPPDVYGHLASVCRGAPRAQQRALWRAVGEAVRERLGEAPLWLSTSGLGVPWMHIRLDPAPKYYSHRPYRAFRRGPDDAILG